MKATLVIWSLMSFSLAAFAHNETYSSDVVRNHEQYLAYVKKSADFAVEFERLRFGGTRLAKDETALYLKQDTARLAPAEFVSFLSEALRQSISGCDVSLNNNELKIGSDKVLLTNVVADANPAFRGGTADPEVFKDETEFAANLAFGTEVTPGYLHVNLYVLPNGAVQGFNLTVIHASNKVFAKEQLTGRMHSWAHCRLSSPSENSTHASEIIGGR